MTEQVELADDPEVDLVGIPEKNRDGEPFDDLVFDAVVSTIEGLPKARRTMRMPWLRVGADALSGPSSTNIGAKAPVWYTS